MFKKFVAFLKGLFTPVEIEDTKVDEYISKQSQQGTVNQVRFSKVVDRPLEQPLKKDEVLVGVNLDEKTAKVVSIESRTVEKAQVTPPKPLNEQLKGVELPSYAKGKTLPPKAKRQFIAQAKRPTPVRRLDDTASSTGGQVTSQGIDPVNAAIYGYAAAAILNDDTPAPVIEECRSSSSYSEVYSSPSYESSPSYDSTDYSSPSCD